MAKAKQPVIHVTIAGAAGVGKSTIAYQIHRLLEGYGLKVAHFEPELNLARARRLKHDPLDLLKSVRDKKPLIIIEEMND